MREQRTALESCLCRAMLAGWLAASWKGYFRPLRWPLMVLMSLEGELYSVLLLPRRADSECDRAPTRLCTNKNCQFSELLLM